MSISHPAQRHLSRLPRLLVQQAEEVRIQGHARGLVLQPVRGVLGGFADERRLERGGDGGRSPFFEDGLVVFLRGGIVVGGGEVPPPLINRRVVEGFFEYGIDDLAGFVELFLF